MTRTRWLRAVAALSLSGALSGNAQAPQPKITEIATIPGVDYIDKAVLLPNRRIIVYSSRDSILAFDRTTKRSTFVATYSRGDWRFGAVSPQGDRIAYRLDGEDGKSRFIWSTPIDPATGTATGPAQRVTTSEGENPEFSPDSKLLAYAAGPDHNALAVVPATGGAERVVARYPRRLSPPTWSADGKWLFVAVGESPDTLVSIERVSVAGGRSDSLLSFPTSIRHWDGGSWGFIEGRVALYRADVRSQIDGRLAYVSRSGARGELRLPQGASVSDHGAEVKGLMTVTTRPVSAHLLNLADGSVRNLASTDPQSTVLTFSPDGRRVVLVRGTRDRLELTVANLDGSESRRYPVLIPADRRRVDWSPDGARLAYFGDPGGAKLMVLELASGESRVVATAPVNVTIQNILWRPDGRSLVLVKRGVDGHSEVSEARIDGSERLLRDLSHDVPGFNPAGGFVDDQTLIMGSPSWKIALVPTAGGPPRELPGTDHRLGWPGVSNDGRHLLWQIRNADGTITSLQWTTSTGDSARTLDLPFTVDRRFPFSTFAPDGRHAVVVGATAGDTTSKLFLISFDGQAPKLLTRLAARAVGRISFSPDGRTLLYNTLGPSSATLYELDLTPVLQAIGAP